jgi:acyl carrier protein
MHAFSAEEALDLMATLAVAPDAQALAMRADWNAFADARPGDRRFFEQVRRREVVTSRLAEANAAPQRTLLAGLAELPESLRLDTAREAMMRLAARALGLPSSARVDASRPLRDLGLDSLMAVELRNAIGTAVGRTLPATLLFEHPSVDALATYVIALLPLDPTGTAVAPEHARAAASHTVAPSSPPIARDAVASLSDDDAEALLLAELAAARSHDPRSRR